MQVKCEFRYFLKFFKFFSKKHLHFLQTSCIISEYGSLVKRLRRRPLTAKTGVRFPYELLKVLQNPFSLKILFYIIWFVGQEAKTSPSHGENRGSIPLRTAFNRSLHGSVFYCADFFLPIINASKKARQFSAGLFLFSDNSFILRRS